MGEPGALAVCAEFRVGDDAAVALGPHRPRTDHHRVHPRAKPLQHLGVGVAADRARVSVDRGAAVEGGGEVEDQIRAVRVGQMLSGRARRAARRRSSRPRRGAAGGPDGCRPGSSSPPSISARCSTLAASSASSLGSPPNQASRISASSASEVALRLIARALASFHLRAPVGGLGIEAEGGAHTLDLVRRDRGAGPGPAADDRLLGAALGDVASGGLACPGPVVALVLGQGAVRERFVSPLAELLDDGLGNAHALVGGDGDLHEGISTASSPRTRGRRTPVGRRRPR